MYICFITYSEVLVLSLKPLTQLPSCDLAVICVWIAALSLCVAQFLPRQCQLLLLLFTPGAPCSLTSPFIVGVTRRNPQHLSSQKTTMEKALGLHKLTKIDKLHQENFPLPP